MNQSKKILDLENKIEHLNNQLNLEIEKNKYQENIIFRQSKMAAMGEMLSIIAHQWKQPLNNVSVLVQEIFFNLKFSNNENIIDKGLQEEIRNQLNYMSETANDFENFFKIDKKKASINLVKILNDNIKLLAIPLRDSNITVDVKCIENGKVLKYNEKEFNEKFLITTYINELKQVLLNILSNSKDALILRDTEPNKKTIYITLERINEHDRTIIIEDNAGGIRKNKELKRIWEPYFTTKKNGTGIGLHICKMIVENNLCGSISSINGDLGLQTTIILRSI